jgi:hypothetical protein
MSSNLGRIVALLGVGAVTWGWSGVSLLAASPAPAKERQGNVADAGCGMRLVPSPDGKGVDFDTAVLSGTIRLDGSYHGVTRLVDKRSGRQLIDARYSALNLFKLMSVNQAMDQPRTMPRTMQIGSSSAEATWGPTETHLATLIARYEVPEPNAVEVTITVRSQGTYAGYEVFLSNYFDKELRPHVYLKPRGAGAPELALPTVNDVFRGTVLVFPRDPHAARHCLDGRWERSERSTPVVQMCPVRYYGYCLGFQADPEQKLAVVLMAHPRDCYAISTRYHADQEADRLTPYSAFDLSLFGDDFLPGGSRTVKVRLALVHLDGDLARPLRTYEKFIAERERQLGEQRASERPPGTPPQKE